MNILSFGGGTNSTAMLIGMRDRGIVPDAITFADTGGEKPHTYLHNEVMQKWCATNGFPPIVTVSNRSNGETLEQECIRRKALPSVAYGFKTCSQKFKIRPQEKYFNSHPLAKAVWDNGEKVRRCIGFDADEPHRAKEYDDPKYENWYPLIEWDWGRAECVEAIKQEGLPLPGKSSCWYCPSSKSSEVRWLAATHPSLMDRAIAMEKNAELTHVKGLGRGYAWSDLIATSDLFEESYIELSCGCYDG